jgi:methylase of polypeptide subunit release factors
LKAAGESQPDLEVLGIDFDPAAIRLSRFNLRLYTRLQADGVVTMRWLLPVSFQQMDLFASDLAERLGGTFDLIVSNPPYIPVDQYNVLEPGVKDWESRAALASSRTMEEDPKGTKFHLRLAELARNGLVRKGGKVVMETNGDVQTEQLARVLKAEITNVETWKDAMEITRVVVISV